MNGLKVSLMPYFVVEVTRIHADEENLLQVVPRDSQEAIVSCLNLHWVNDLPGSMPPNLCRVHGTYTTSFRRPCANQGGSEARWRVLRSAIRG